MIDYIGLRDQFQELFSRNARNRQIDTRVIENLKTMTFEQYNGYIDEFSDVFVDTFKSIFTEEYMNGKGLYYDTFNNVIRQMLEMLFDREMELSKAFYDELLLKSGLSLKSSIPEKKNIERNIKYLKEELCKMDNSYAQIVSAVEDYVPTTSKYFCDEFSRYNAEKQKDLGFNTTVTRRAYYNACKYCLSKQGTYDYDEVKDTGNEVWKRHRSCRCIVVYENEFFKQNAHTKDIIERKDVKRVLNTKG